MQKNQNDNNSAESIDQVYGEKCTYTSQVNLFDKKCRENGTFENGAKVWPVGTGISGTAAQRGKIYNVANVKEIDGNMDFCFNPDIDNLKSDIDVTSMLSVPVFVELESDQSNEIQHRVCAVVTVVSESSEIFSRREVEWMKGLADCCGHAFFQGQQFEKFHAAEVQRKVNMELHAAHSEPPAERLNELKVFMETMEVPNNLNHLDFCGWKRPIQEKVGLLVHMFNRLFEDKFDYNKDVLSKFFQAVAMNYRSEVDYHNFHHAFEVAQTIFAILETCRHGFTLVESVALFLAGICHDLDHRGLTNKFNNEQSTQLAKLHADATMEHHHFRMTVGLLTNGNTNFLMSWPNWGYTELLTCIKYNILSTDLPSGRNHLQELQELYPNDEKITFRWSDDHHRELLMSVVMSIADFHMSYYDWEDYRIVLDPMLNEFWAQGDLETRMGRSIKIDPIFDRGEIQHVPKFQIGFLANISLPYAQFFARIFGRAKIMVDNCKFNIEKWGTETYQARGSRTTTVSGESTPGNPRSPHSPAIVHRHVQLPPNLENKE